MILGFAAAAALLGAAQAHAAPAQGHTNPDWLKAPTEQDLRGLWPVEAWKQQLSGRVRLECEVDLQGLVQDCSVKTETPPGMGFGIAALALTPKFLFRPATDDGHPVISRVTIPVNFEMQGGRRSTQEPMTSPTGSHIPNSAVYSAPPGPTYALTADVPWTRAPTEGQLEAAYPKGAKPETAFGHVALACSFTKAGDLTDCLTDAEEPKGQGFAAAARSLEPLFHVAPEDGVDLRRVKVNIAVHFTAPSHRADKRVIDHPDWVSAASAGGDLFPPQAAKAGLNTGRAVLDCVADETGKLGGCQVTSEDPAGMGFGAAALKTAGAVAINRWTSNGEPAEGAHVIFAVRVNKDQGGPSAKPAGGS